MLKKYLRLLIIFSVVVIVFSSCKKKERKVQTPPIADAGGNQDLFLNDTAILDASKSSDKDGDKLKYQWEITSAPEGSTATIENDDEVKASLKSDVIGTYEVTLTVSDGTLKSVQAINVSFFKESSWTMFGVDPKHSGKSDSYGPIDGKLAWQLTSQGTFGTCAVAKDGTVYLGNTNGTFKAVKNGEILWEFKANRGINSAPALDKNGNIYFGASDNGMYSLKPDGTLRWIFRTAGDIDSPCIIKDDVLYFGSADSYVYAIDLEGNLKWKFKTGGAVYASPAIGDDGTVYVGSADYSFYAIKNGKFFWNFVTSAEVLASAAIDENGNIYFGSLDNFFYSLDKNGGMRWAHKTRGAIYSTPAIDGDRLYFGSHDKYIYSLQISDGAELWRVRTGAKVSSPAVVDMNQTVYIGSNDGKLYALNRKGDILWNYETQRLINYSPVIGPKGYLYVASWDRTFSALKDL